MWSCIKGCDSYQSLSVFLWIHSWLVMYSSLLAGGILWYHRCIQLLAFPGVEEFNMEDKLVNFINSWGTLVNINHPFCQRRTLSPSARTTFNCPEFAWDHLQLPRVCLGLALPQVPFSCWSSSPTSPSGTALATTLVKSTSRLRLCGEAEKWKIYTVLYISLVFNNIKLFKRSLCGRRASTILALHFPFLCDLV